MLVVPNPQTVSTMVVEASQPLLQGFWDRTNRAIISIAKLNVDISKEEFRQTVQDVITEVARAYWQLALEREYEIISTQVLEMAE